MNTQRFVLSIGLTLALVAIVLAPGLASLAQAQGPDEAAAACTADFKQKWMPKGNCKTNDSIHFLGTLDNQGLVFKTNAAERMRINAIGNVGIGTSIPQQKLHVCCDHSRLRLESGSHQAWTVTEYKADSREWHTGVGGSAVSNDVKSKYYIFDGTASQFRMTIDTNGNVGIGQTAPTAKLEVKGDGGPGLVFRVASSNGSKLLSVSREGFVSLAILFSATTKHACLGSGLVFADCSSAAEYVPTIDGGKGYPQTADLVSIAPKVKNPYGDTHGPFVVQKSTTARDPNLLGFIVNPESGADGKKLNNHYLPLAIYGYFPAKVTMENGVIRRGDPLTSSSKPGYAMKATDACKTIGYALEDARAEGTIQVFAHLSENAASEVAELRQEIDGLTQDNQVLKQENAALKKENTALEQKLAAIETRLSVLEGATQVQAHTTR